MKWRKILALGLCVALVGTFAGCGSSSGEGSNNMGSGQNVSASGQVQSGGQSGETGQVGENVQGGEAGQSKENGQGGEAGQTGENGQGGEGSVRKLGAGGGEALAPVTLENAYQRAAYLADQVYAKNQSSTLVSPLSLEVALGLVAEGASGETARELYKYLGNEQYADWVQSYMQFAESLDAGGDAVKKEEGKYSFHYELANSIWVRKDDKLNPEYQKLVQKKFQAVAENVDFVGEAQKTADRINAWCDERTHGMIPKMVEPDMFSKELAAILMNSVYFESPWADEWGLTEHTFTDVQGKQKSLEMLSDRLEVYYENAYATAFAKRYYNGFQFIGILPKQEGDFRLSDLDLKSLLESQTYEYDVNAIAPKLNFETTAENIVDILKAQGVQQVFDNEFAELDRLVDGRPLYVSDIVQKCKIEMDEAGTRAAAVTMILAEDCCAIIEEPKEVKDVYLDRPFAFLIYDSINDQIVFAGKVTEVE